MKGSRFLTHRKKLKDPAPGIARFFERADMLAEKLGPIVFQLPPNWEADAGRLEAFLRELPHGHRSAFELRNATWHSPQIYALLRRYRAAFCIFEIAASDPVSRSLPISRMSGCTDPARHIKAATPKPRCANGPIAFAAGKPNCARFTFISITIKPATLRKTHWSWRKWPIWYKSSRRRNPCARTEEMLLCG